MPQTTSKRIALTLPPKVYLTIDRLGRAQNKAMATVIAEILEEQEPLLDVMADALEAATQGKFQEAGQKLQVLGGKAVEKLGLQMQVVGRQKEQKTKKR
jgi:hypothetical protein